MTITHLSLYFPGLGIRSSVFWANRSCLWKNEWMRDSLKKPSDLLICSFLVSDLSESKWANERIPSPAILSWKNVILLAERGRGWFSSYYGEGERRDRDPLLNQITAEFLTFSVLPHAIAHLGSTLHRFNPRQAQDSTIGSSQDRLRPVGSTWDRLRPVDSTWTGSGQ